MDLSHQDADEAPLVGQPPWKPVALGVLVELVGVVKVLEGCSITNVVDQVKDIDHDVGAAQRLCTIDQPPSCTSSPYFQEQQLHTCTHSEIEYG